MGQRTWTPRPAAPAELTSPGGKRLTLVSALAIAVLVGSATLIGQGGAFSSSADRLTHSACTHFDKAARAASTGDEPTYLREIKRAAGDATFSSSDALARVLDTMRSSHVTRQDIGAAPDQANLTAVVDDTCADFTGPLWWLTSP